MDSHDEVLVFLGVVVAVEEAMVRIVVFPGDEIDSVVLVLVDMLDTGRVVCVIVLELAVVAVCGVGGEPAVVVGPWQWLTLQHSTRIM